MYLYLVESRCLVKLVMKVLVTGASGLLGREVVKVIKERGWKVISVAYSRLVTTYHIEHSMVIKFYNKRKAIKNLFYFIYFGNY